MDITPTTDAFTLTTIKAEPRIDSRLLAKSLGNKHRHVMALLDKYMGKFKTFGQVSFKNADGDRAQGGGKAERFALLNEDQAFFLLALSRNNDHVVSLKVKLVKAFGEVRRAAGQHGTEYLPSYHQLHDELHTLAAGSDHERHVHINVNRLINKTVGLEPGQRSAASMPAQSLLAVAQAVAVKAARGAPDHRVAYQRIKSAMVAFSAVTLLGVSV